MTAGQDWIIAAVVATEVPPPGTHADFTDPMVADAIRAVCEVIRNRVADGRPEFADGATSPNAVQVVLARNQFSAVCRENYWKLACAGKWEPAHVQHALDVWQHEPPIALVPGATHYFSPISMSPPGSVPSWVAGKEEVVVDGLSGDYFRFYREPA